MSKKENSTFNQFFKSDRDILKDMLEKEDHSLKESIAIKGQQKMPKIPKGEDLDEDTLRKQWQEIRSFFRNAHNPKSLPKDFSPILLSPLYTEKLIIGEYPVWVSEIENKCLPLIELLKIASDEENASLVHPFLERMTQQANQSLHGQAKDISRVIDEAGKKMLDDITMSGEEKNRFSEELKKVMDKLPKEGRLIPYSSEAPYVLLNAALQAAASQYRSLLTLKIKKYHSKLKELLQIEEEKNPGSNDSHKSIESKTFVDSMVKFDKITSMMPESGGVSMSPERVKRIREVVMQMDHATEILKVDSFLFVDPDAIKAKKIGWENIFSNSNITAISPDQGIAAMVKLFNDSIAEYTSLIVATRTAELELDNKYQPDVHNEYFKHFHWQNFSQEEMNAFSNFIMITSDTHLYDEDYTSISRLLSKNIPIKLLVIREDKKYSKDGVSDDDQDDLHALPELGAMMLTHRNIYVSQSTSVTPHNLFNDFVYGLNVFAPAFFYMLDNNGEDDLKNYLHTSATVESRDFPSFTFKGMLGTPWGSRFNVDNNPQPALPWTEQSIKVEGKEGEVEMQITFTFADMAALRPEYGRYFLPVSPSFWGEDLIPLNDYILLEEQDVVGKVPYIWMIDGKNHMHKVAVSWPMVMATQERLDFWRFLQENSGINNFHVNHAVEKTRQELQQIFDNELQAVKQQHALDIEKARDEEAESVMDNLTAALLDLNLNQTSLQFSNQTSRQPKEPVAVKEKEVEKEAKKEDDQDDLILSNDPYIDTALCTSCNECINLNGALFKYNADKMAYIANPKAGTFKELVEAAEKCPVDIIHPGSPLDPDEPNLDDLIARAEKFN